MPGARDFLERLRPIGTPGAGGRGCGERVEVGVGAIVSRSWSREVDAFGCTPSA